MQHGTTLLTAQQLEEFLGKKYFYRQGIYRLAEEGKISPYQVEGTLYFSSQEVVFVVLKRLATRLQNRFLWLNINPLRIHFDEVEGKIITIYGFPSGRKIEVNTEAETEEDLLTKVERLREEVKKMPDIPVRPIESRDEPPPPPPSHGHHPPPPHQREIMDVLRRIEERLLRIEERLR